MQAASVSDEQARASELLRRQEEKITRVNFKELMDQSMKRKGDCVWYLLRLDDAKLTSQDEKKCRN